MLIFFFKEESVREEIQRTLTNRLQNINKASRNGIRGNTTSIKNKP